MRLSDAIRLGAMLRPQGFERLFHQGHSCAIGAAFEAGNVPAGTRDIELASFFDDVPLGCRLRCPQCAISFTLELGKPSAVNLAIGITHLNDIHRWPRERIADWVETLERADDRPSAPASDRQAEVPPTLATRA